MRLGALVQELLAGLDFWTVSRATALVSAIFGVGIVARACWDNTGLPALRDRHLELVSTRGRELGEPPAPAPLRRSALVTRQLVRAVSDPRLILAPAGGHGWLRRLEHKRRSRPSAAQRHQAAVALAALLKRPGLVQEQDDLLRPALAVLEPGIRAAATEDELKAISRLRFRTAAALLGAPAARRFFSVFLPAMGRYLDFVGRGSALGLAAGVLVSGGMSSGSELVGILTTVCGVGGAIVFTATVIRCDARSWPAQNSRLSEPFQRGYPEASFLLRLLLTVSAVLVAVAILRQ